MSCRVRAALAVCLLAVASALTVAVPSASAAADEVAVTILSPSAGEVVSGVVTIRTQIVVSGTDQPRTLAYTLGGRRWEQPTQLCSSTCTYTTSVDTTPSPWPNTSSTAASGSGQVDDGPLTLSVQVRSNIGTVLGRGTRDVIVDNGRPRLSATPPAVPSTVGDGRVTVDRRLRVQARAVPGGAGAIQRIEGRVYPDLGGAFPGFPAIEFTLSPPATPGGDWVLDQESSAWTQGPALLDLSAVDESGRRSATTRIPLMVSHGFTLPSTEPPAGATVRDDLVGMLRGLPRYDRYVKGSWPVSVTTLVDGRVLRPNQPLAAYEGASEGVSLSVGGVGQVVASGTRRVTWQFTDNRGVVSTVERDVSVSRAGSLTLTGPPPATTRAGRPFTVAFRATDVDGVAGVGLDDVASGATRDRVSCPESCSKDRVGSLTFVPTTVGSHRLRVSLQSVVPGSAARTVDLTVSVLPATKDFSGDGKPDVVGVDGTGRMLLFQGDGRGGWAAGSRVIGSGWGGFTSVVSTGDLNRDLLPDLLAQDRQGLLRGYQTDGTGRWTTPAGVPFSFLTPGSTPIPGVGDFDGDGSDDIILRNSRGQLELRTGRKGFATSVVVGSGWSNFTAVFSPGDFNGDGARDLLARSQDGRLWLYAGNGRGGWAAPGRVVGSGWAQFKTATGPGDFDGDGHVDVIATHATTGAMTLFRGNGKGSWLPSRTIGSGWTTFRAVIGVGS